MALKFRPDFVAIQFRRDTTADERQRIFRCLNAVKIEYQDRRHTHPSPNAGFYHLDLPPGTDLRTVFESLRSEPSVLWASPDVLEDSVCDEYPEDPEFPKNSALDNTGQTRGVFDADIDATEGWDIWNAPFMRETVAVIDTGMDYNHPELASCGWLNYGEYNRRPGIDDDGNGYIDDISGWDFVDGDNDPMDPDGHGTMVAGVIAAAAYNGEGMAGLCREISILPIRAVRGEGECSYLDVQSALEYAIACRVDVINCSFGLTQSTDGLRRQLQAAHEAGILVVCSAGNRKVDLDAVSPLHFPRTQPFSNVVTVTGTDQWDRLIRSFGYGATKVLLAAPGNEVGTTTLEGKTDTVAGTSFASPQVTGAVALAIGLWRRVTDRPYDRPTVAQLRAAIVDGVDPLPSLEGKCVTGGRLNLPRLLRAFAGSDRNSLFGTVWRTTNRLPGAKITVSGEGRRETYSSADGRWAMHALPDGTYTVTPSHPGLVFSPASQTVTLRGASEAVPLFTGCPDPPRRFGGAIRQGEIPVEGALVRITGPVSASMVTGPEGGFVFNDLIEGEYDVEVSREGMTISPSSTHVEVRGGDAVIRFVAEGIGRAPGEAAEAIALLDRTTARSRIRLTEAGDVPELAVYVDLVHDRPSDLRIALVAPDGGSVLLRRPRPGFLHDVSGWYGRDIVPDEPLTRLAARELAGEWTLEVTDEVEGEVGELRAWRIEPRCRRPRSVSEVFRDVGAALRDRSTVESTIEVSETEIADTVQVYVEVRHPARNDLCVTATAPDGQEVILTWARSGAADVVGWFGRDLPAEGPMERLAGRPRGTWRLRVRDIARGDEGTVVRWGLAFVRDLSLRPAHLVLGTGSGGRGILEVLAGGHRHAAWVRLGLDGYDLGEARPACGDVDGDGLDEMAIGVGRSAGSGGWVAIRDDAVHGRALLRWLSVPDAAYCAMVGETRPALGDVDGDGRAEVLIGLGVGGGGRVAWFDDAQADFASRGFVGIGFPAYSLAAGETRPACGDVDGDGRAEVVVGLAPFPSNGGHVPVLSLGMGGATRRRWLRVPWRAYNEANGEVWPACGDVDGDGRDEVVLGLGGPPGDGGRVCVLDDLVAGARPMRWLRFGWGVYHATGGPARPVAGDWDGDGRAEVAIGTGPFPQAGGWVALYDDAGRGYARLGSARLHWGTYDAANGETWPVLERDAR